MRATSRRTRRSSHARSRHRVTPTVRIRSSSSGQSAPTAWLLCSPNGSTVDDLPDARDQISSPRSAPAPSARTGSGDRLRGRFVAVPRRPERHSCLRRPVCHREAELSGRRGLPLDRQASGGVWSGVSSCSDSRGSSRKSSNTSFETTPSSCCRPRMRAAGYALVDRSSGAREMQRA